MQALASMDPSVLFFLEGVSQDCCVDGVGYGNGFITNRDWLFAGYAFILAA